MRAKYSKFAKPVVIVTALIVIVVLIFQSFPTILNPYLSVSEVVDNHQQYVNKQVQVIGNVSTIYSRVGEELLFSLTDGKEYINVTYSKAAPQGFTEGKRIVVIGTVISKTQIRADNILTACPSKYQG